VSQRQLVPQRPDHREHDGQRPVVGVAAAVRLHGDVLGERHPRGQAGLLRREPAALDEPAQDVGRRRGQEFRGDLGTGDLGEQLPGPRDAALDARIRAQPGDRAPDDGRGQLQVGRGGDLRHRGAHQQVDQALLMAGLGRRVDQVHTPVVPAGQAAAQLLHGTLDDRQREPGGAEEPEHLRAGHRHDRGDGRDAVGHLAGDVGEPHAVGAVEGPVAEPLGVERGQGAEELESLERAGGRCEQPPAEPGARLVTGPAVHDVDGLAEPADTLDDARG
jgi:hypothetical protein